ncbi:MAG: ANTAR domain-containing protein [Ruminiclostridium sp.]|nr:ANTAR domain-containing protein [Ruminiclostridium sp.]
MKKKILIAAGNEKACRTYSEMLGENEYEITAVTEAAALRALDPDDFSVFFISLPLADESGIKLLDELAGKAEVPICAVVRPDIPEKALERLVNDNAYILKRPVSRSNLVLAAELLSSFYGKSAGMRARITELERKNDEIKLMSRAKLVLIETRGMSENDAHRYILRTAMNSQSSIDEVCRDIIAEGSDDV